jgi:membrane protease YdiL (CAAX protease family)
VIALLPLPLCLLIAWRTGQDGVALLAVPIGLGLAWWMLRLRGERWADLGLRRARAPGRLLATVLAATALLLVTTTVLERLLSALTGWTPDISRFDALRGNLAALAAGLVLVWTSAAFGEELLMRGFVMHSLHRMLGGSVRPGWAWGSALVVSSGLFGAAHAYQGAAGAILAGAIGLGYGLTFFAARRNLWGPILTHGLYDTAGFLLVYASWDRLLLPA